MQKNRKKSNRNLNILAEIKKNRQYFDIHADDYAVSANSSRQIISLLEMGALDSISVIPNMDCFEQSMRYLTEAWENFPNKPKISVHLNLMEGKSCGLNADLLTDSSGHLSMTWGKLLTYSFFPLRGKNELKKQLQLEIATQLDKVWESLPSDSGYRIDSHQHTHMIPIVSDALMEVLNKKNISPEFIRVAREPVLPFLKKPELYKSYSFVNLVKNIILNIFSVRLEHKLKEVSINPGYMWGVLMSGRMDRERIMEVFPDMLHYCIEKQKRMEILFHPGLVLSNEIAEEYNKKGFVEFHTSEQRTIEFDSVSQLFVNKTKVLS